MTPVPAYPSRVATDADLKVAVNLVQTTLNVSIGVSDTIIFVASVSGFVANCLVSIDNEIIAIQSVTSGGTPSLTVAAGGRGFDGTVAAAHSAGANVSMLIDAWHHNAMAAEVKAIEQFLGPNGTSLTYSSPVLQAKSYAFSPQSPGGSLAVGNNTITLTPVPLGVNGSDQNHWLYVSGGPGSPEPALITGGTAVSGASSGTLIIQCANTHTGAWTIGTATLGITEALNQLPGGVGQVDLSSYTGSQNTWATVWIMASQQVSLGTATIIGPPDRSAFRLAGDGSKLTGLGPSTSMLTSASPTQPVVIVANAATGTYSQNHLIADLQIRPTASAGNGILLYAAWYSLVRNVKVRTGGTSSTGNGIELRDQTFVGTSQGAYGNTFDRVQVGVDGSGTGFAQGIFLNTLDGAWGVTVVNLMGCWSAWNAGTGLVVGATSSVHWVKVVGGAFDYNGSHAINLKYSDQFWLSGADVEGNGGFGLTGVIATEVMVEAAFSNNTSGNIDPALNFTKKWDFSDMDPNNRGDIRIKGGAPKFVFRNNNFTLLGDMVGIDYDGMTLCLTYNARPSSATQATLLDPTYPGTVLRVSNAGVSVLTAPVGSGTQTLTQRLFIDTSGRVQFGAAVTAAGTAALGANCPATTPAAPYTWITALAPDGTVVYLPAWR